MRTWKLMTCLAFALFIVTAVGAEPTMQRGRGGGGRGAVTLDEEELLENFHRMVEIIWTDDEKDGWGDARSDDDKRAFIEAFWARRDPTPGTPDNEFRDIYMGRVAATLSTFGNEGTEGYRTDRGKVFIIYGGNALLAQERRQGGGAMSVSTAEAGEGVGGGGRGGGQAFMYVWTMDAAINPFLEEKTEIIFAPFQGSFPMSTRGVELSEEAFLANRDVQELLAARRANPTAAMSGAGTGPSADAPPEAEAMRGLMEDGVERSDLALQQDFRFFPAPDGNTYTVVAFEVGKDGLTFAADNVKAFGLLLRDDPDQGEIPVHQIDANFTISADEGANDDDSATHTFSVTLAPGPHRMAWGVMDTASRRITTVNETFEVPSFVTQDLMLTSVAMSKSAMQQTQDPIDIAKVYDVMRLGPFELDIDVDRTFARNGTISLLYFVMGTGVDAATGQAQIEVTHRVLMAADDTSIAVLPEQVLTAPAISQNIPLAQISQLEAGTDYKIQIHVKDLITGNELTHELPFSVAPEGS